MSTDIMSVGMGPVRVVVFAAASVAAWTAAVGVGAAKAPRAARCPSASRASSLRQFGPAARADVDADGQRDRVWIVASPTAPSSCGIFLVAQTAAGFAAIVVPGHVGGDAATSLHDGLPRLFGLLRLGSNMTLEPVVIVDRGAQAVSFAVYRLAAGALVRMRLPAPATDVLRWEDSQTQFGSVDCAGVGLVQDSFASRRPDGRWDVRRHVYRVGADFATRSSFADVETKKPAPPKGLPFTSCEGVRAG